jgi:hypothetical protein
MVFGILIDVSIVVGGYFLMLRYRRQLAARLARIKLPSLAVCMLLSVPLIILEKQINCMPSWCGTVLIPPTLTILLIEIFGLSLITLKIHAKNAFHVSAIYSVFGVFIEASTGGLLSAGLLIALLFAPYVWISYSFISLLPISVLMADRRLPPKNPEISAVDRRAEPARVG